MALGDAVVGIQSLAVNATLDIRPASGVEWVIHNIKWNQGTVEVYDTNGTLLSSFYTDSSKGGLYGTVFHVTYGQWIQVKNIGPGSTIVSYDGMQTK